jgi:hypothetical protein
MKAIKPHSERVAAALVELYPRDGSKTHLEGE